MRKLFFLLFLLLLASIFTTNVLAQDNIDGQKNVKYDLAYPGILPDNPFYILKVLRTKLTENLISDPKQKIEFYLLEADKGILATAILVDKHNTKLADQTALKAENNMTLITFEMKKISSRLDNKLADKLQTASLKHQEVLKSLIARLLLQDRETLEKVLSFSQRNLNTIQSIQAKKSSL